VKLKKSKDSEITVLLALQKIVKVNKQITQITNDTKKAIELHKEQITILEGVVNIDEEVLKGKNKVRKLLDKAKSDLTTLEEEGMSNKVQKEAHHKSYTLQRG